MEQKGTLKYRKVQRTPQTGENAGKKKWYATSYLRFHQSEVCAVLYDISMFLLLP